MGKTIYLISCSKSKAQERCQASELYTSSLFRKSVQYVESIGGEWFVLSAKYGLVLKETVIDPYDETLNDKNKKQREEWANSIFEQIKNKIGIRDNEFVFLAGKVYSEKLITIIESNGGKTANPMVGLGIGQRLKWLNQNGE